MEDNKRIIALYQDYNLVIKPLIAEVEARTEQFFRKPDQAYRFDSFAKWYILS